MTTTTVAIVVLYDSLAGVEPEALPQASIIAASEWCRGCCDQALGTVDSSEGITTQSQAPCVSRECVICCANKGCHVASGYSCVVQQQHWVWCKLFYACGGV